MPRVKPLALRKKFRTRPQRSHFVLRKWGRRFRRFSKAIVVFALIAIPISFWSANIYDDLCNWSSRVFNSNMAKAGMVVKDVLVEGRQQTTVDDVLKTIAVHRGDSIFKVIPAQVRTSLEALPWIKSATVQRILPNTIYVILVERQPIALWKKNEKLYLIDDAGDVISKVKQGQFSKLLIVVGEGAPKQVAKLARELISFPLIKRQVSTAVYVGGRRWDLVLNDKLRVKLPENNIGKALEHLVQLEQMHHIADGKVQTIDIRLPDRSFLYMSPDGVINKSRGRHT